MARLGPLVDTRLHQVVPKGPAPTATIIDTYLRKQGSPLAGMGSTFVKAGSQYGVDPRFLAAISGGETSFGKYGPSQRIHNPFGLGPGISYPDYPAAINAAAKTIAGYRGRGATTIPAISKIWAPVGASNDPNNLNSNWVSTNSSFYRALGGNPAGAVSGPGAGGPSASATSAPAVNAAGTPVAPSGVDPTLLAGLAKYAQESGKTALAGRGGGELSATLLASLTKAAVAPRVGTQVTTEVAKGAAPRVVPPVSGRSGVAVQAAMQELGVPYSWGGGSPGGPTTGIGRGAGTKGFDCSALIQYAWGKAGVQLPRTTYDQIHVGTSVPNLASAVAGDLLFPHAGHVLMYLGNGKAIESPHTGAEVQVSDVTGRAFQTIRRPG